MTYDALSANGTASRSFTLGDWFRLLITDQRILISWLVFLGFSIFGAYALLNALDDGGSGPPTGQIVLPALTVGYVAWSMYWGLPGCFVLFARLWKRLLFGFSVWGFALLGFVLVGAFLLLVCYPPFGGGIFHFIRRWWKSGKQRQHQQSPAISAPSHATAAVIAPAVTAPPVIMPPAAVPIVPPPVDSFSTPPARSADPMSEIEQRLRALAQLYDRGVISRDEHDRRRVAILDKV